MKIQMTRGFGFILLSLVPILARATSGTVTNIYAQANAVFQSENAAHPMQAYHAALGGGMAAECMNDTFRALCNFVSNHCEEIAADWMSYETNDVVRFTTLSAAGFSGFDNLTNLAAHVLSLYEVDANAISWQTIEMLSSPDDPPEAAHYLCLNYDVPGVSNLVNRFKAIYVGRGEMDRASLFDADLSGEGKRDYLDMKAAGAL